MEVPWWRHPQQTTNAGARGSDVRTSPERPPARRRWFRGPPAISV